MSRLLNRRCLTYTLVLTALSLVLSAPVSSQERTSNAGATPGSLALLANKFDASAVKAIGPAIADRDPVVRAVAARIVGVVSYPPLADAIARALEQEQDAQAAVEQARALLLIRGDLATPVIERRMNAFSGLAGLYAEWMMRARPQTPGSSTATPVTGPGPSNSGPAMRTVPLFWPGFLRNVLDAAGCKVKKHTPSGAVLVGYDVTGRVNSLAVGPTKLPGGCDDAVIALARLSFADPTSPRSPTAKEWLVLPLNDEYVECAASSESWTNEEPVPILAALGIQPPKKTRDVRPIYPEVLQQKRIEGAVVLEGIISKTGCIPSLRIVRSVDPKFDYAALYAASGWRFTPTLLDGRPVNVRMTITVNFTLH